jgi:hypothetical protein
MKIKNRDRDRGSRERPTVTRPEAPAPAGESVPVVAEAESGDEVLSAGWNPDIERLAQARAYPEDEARERPKRR